MDRFHLQLSPISENNVINSETPETPNKSNDEDEDELYKQFIFDEKYIINNLNVNENVDYKTNDVLEEKRLP